ncbi:hypothetical protein OKW24_001462 [Peribacillus simplex]|nr:hypothetical protein [Peribacillus simplex]
MAPFIIRVIQADQILTFSLKKQLRALERTFFKVVLPNLKSGILGSNDRLLRILQ